MKKIAISCLMLTAFTLGTITACPEHAYHEQEMQKDIQADVTLNTPYAKDIMPATDKPAVGQDQDANIDTNIDADIDIDDSDFEFTNEDGSGKTLGDLYDSDEEQEDINNL